MKKFKAIASALLAAATVLSLTACEEEGVNSNSGAPGNATPATTTTIASTTYAENAGVNDAVTNMDPTALDNPDLKVTKRLKWLAWNNWTIDETSAAAMLFKEVYGIPETGDDPSCAGQIFENFSTSYEDRYTKLGSMIASGDSPDLFPFEALDFPYGVTQNRYNAIDDIVDLNSAKWDATRDLMEMYAFNGKHYCAFYEISPNNLMYYRPALIDEIGADDPKELFDKGEWTWDAFLDIARRWQSSAEGRYAIDGYNPENDFVISTGKPMVSNENGQLVNNLYSPEFERVQQNMLGVLQSENLRYPRHELNSWNINTKEWLNGNVLFYADGGFWVWKDNLAKYATSGKFTWGPDDVSFVPFPKDPMADDYYIALKQDAQMYVKGAENVDGIKAWIDCCATVANDPDVRTASFEQAIENYGWTRKNLEFYYELTALDGSSPVKLLADFKGGLGTVSDGSSTQNPIQSLTNMPYLTGESYVQLREQHNPAIQDAIDQINEALRGL